MRLHQPAGTSQYSERVCVAVDSISALPPIRFYLSRGQNKDATCLKTLKTVGGGERVG